jgi:hypothetical protein
LRAAERWRARRFTLEAMLWLLAARVLVALVPLARWRRTLGRPVPPERAGSTGGGSSPDLRACQLAKAVQRAALRLPGQSLCLPQAMALQWMLRVRGIGATLLIGVLPGSRSGGIDDLHAWVVRHGELLIGQTAEIHVPIYSAVTWDDVHNGD